MARITTRAGSEPAPQISRQSVEAFFRERAAKVEQLGYIQAVIYQDKNPDLARQRDAVEKAKLLPLLQLDGRQSVLDVGCGTGRWADVLAPLCSRYLGTDFSQELVDIGSARFASVPHVSFVCLPAEQVSSATVGGPWQVIVSLGLFIYLNDDELARAMKGYASVSDSSCKLLLREPVGTQGRLTIKEHFSEDMDQVYNAIYRTEEELMDFVRAILAPAGFRLSVSGDVYEEAMLNNRPDTKQKWFLLER